MQGVPSLDVHLFNSDAFSHLFIDSFILLSIHKQTHFYSIPIQSIYFLAGNVFCASRIRVPSVTLLFDILSFPSMMRVIEDDDRKKKIEEETEKERIEKVDNKDQDLGLQIPDSDMKNKSKCSNMNEICDNRGPLNISSSHLARSYVNVKRYCRPWPSCIIQE